MDFKIGDKVKPSKLYMNTHPGDKTNYKDMEVTEIISFAFLNTMTEFTSEDGIRLMALWSPAELELISS